MRCCFFYSETCKIGWSSRRPLGPGSRSRIASTWYSHSAPGLNTITFTSLLKISWTCPPGKFDPLLGRLLFSTVPSSNSGVSVSYPWKALWMTWRPLRAPILPWTLLRELQRYNQQMCCTGCKGSRKSSWITDPNLVCVFVEKHIFYTDPWLYQANRIWLS